MHKYASKMIMIILLLILLPWSPSINAEKPISYETAAVVRVVDGDTLQVEVNGSTEKVRLIGVNTPESTGEYESDPQPGGIEASAFMKELLPEGTVIYLEADVRDRDKYGRLLRYVWLDEPNPSEIEKSMVNQILMEEGYAEPMTIKPDVRYADYFEIL